MVGKPSLDAPRDELRAGVEGVDGPERYVAMQAQGGASVPGRVPEESRAAAHDRVLPKLIGEAETRRKPFLEGLDACASAHAVAACDEDRRRCRIEIGPQVVYFGERCVELVTQPEVQRQLRRGAPVVADIGAVLGAAHSDVSSQEVILLDRAWRAEQKRRHGVAAGVVHRVVGDVGREVETAVAAVGLKLAHVPAA